MMSKSAIRPRRVQTGGWTSALRLPHFETDEWDDRREDPSCGTECNKMTKENKALSFASPAQGPHKTSIPQSRSRTTRSRSLKLRQHFQKQTQHRHKTAGRWHRRRRNVCLPRGGWRSCSQATGDLRTRDMRVSATRARRPKLRPSCRIWSASCAFSHGGRKSKGQAEKGGRTVVF